MDYCNIWTKWEGRPGNWQRCLGWLMVVLLLATSGCVRRFYRNRADKEVAHLLKEKDRYPFWKIENYHVYPDPRARFADPTNPDRPPMPPDDPAAWAMAPKPQKPGRAGVARVEGHGYLGLMDSWDQQNRATAAAAGGTTPSDTSTGEGIQQAVALTFQADKDEPAKMLPPPKILPPDVSEAAPTTSQPRPYLLNMDQALALAILNSREFQTRREDLYLAALPVSLERFSFTAQFLAIETAVREVTGRESSAGKGNRWRVDSTNGVGKLFSTGALLLAAFANKTVVELTGDLRHTTSQSTINLDIIQPLLRGGGKAVTLEPLTQSERNLLYEIRSYARFRKEFNQAIIGGGDIGPGAGVGGGFGGGVRVGGVSPVTGGNAARLIVSPGTAGRIDLAAAQAAPTEGFLSTLLKRAQLNIEQKNVSSLESFLKLYEAFEEGGEVSNLQVAQVRTQLLGGRTRVLRGQQDLRDALDRFKLQLGVPVPLGLTLNDDPILPVTRQLERYDTILKQYEQVVKEVDSSDSPAEVAKLRGRIHRLLLQSNLVRETVNFQKKIPERLARWERLELKNLEDELNKKRFQVRDLLDRKAEAEARGQPWPSSEQQRLSDLEADVQVGELARALRRYEMEPWTKLPDEKERKVMQAARFRDVRNAFGLVIGDASNERMALLRPDWPPLPPMEVAGQDLLKTELEEAYNVATGTALTNRLDLMNARAQLQDAWRQIAIFANSLLGTVLVGYHLDTTTPPGEAKPFTFAGSRGRHQLVLNLDLPLVRLPERNSYRASLIAYQRERRALMAAEDFVTNQVRVDLRNLRVLAENFKIQQEAVDLAYLRVENALETFRAPPQPGQGGGSSAGSAAALTQQLLSAQTSLLQAQNQLLTVWINYLVARRQLYLNMELLTLDPRGVWIDDLPNNHLAASPQRSGPEGTAQPAIASGGHGRPILPVVRLLPPSLVPPAPAVR